MKKARIFIVLLFAYTIGWSQCNLVVNYTYTLGVSGQINFTNTSSNLPINTHYTWNFGDNTTSLVENATHTFAYNGTYSVSLTITGDSSVSDTSMSCHRQFVQAITITNASPCNLQAHCTYTLGANGLITFSDASVGTSTNTVYSYFFFSNPNYPYDTVNAATHAYIFPNNGTYTVTYQAIDTNGACASTYTTTFTIANAYSCSTPQASFVYSLGNNGIVHFTSTSTNIPATTKYSWSFGSSYLLSATYTTTPSPTVQYPANSSFQVSLQVYDSLHPSCSATTHSFVPISNATGCSILSNVTYTVGAGGVVTFSISATSPNPLDTVFYYEITYGYGHPTFIDSVHASSLSTSHTYTYSTTGFFYDSVIVFCNNTACIARKSFQININSPCQPPQISFSHTSLYPGYWQVVATYSNVSTARWNWGDGTYTYGLSPSHTYTVPGLYQICATGWGIGGCNDSIEVCQNDSVYRTQSVIHVQVINSTMAGIEQLTNNQNLELYPNPVASILQVTLGEKPLENVAVYDVIGNRVMDKQSSPIDVSTLPNGVYFIRIGAIVRKIMVQH
ncbi:MAG: T9SS type A sorting domain-containing protein [Bacteroidetes bacterium]|nr:T9SS type A sorting domain-containing protein [Bacteroidota bacterium]